MLKLKISLSILASMLLAQGIWGQLVNAGFEVCSAFPTATGQWQLVQGWNNAGSLVASPDYFNYLGSVEADIPETPVAIVNSYEGDGVMGFIACGPKDSNRREYITSVFSEPMEVGKDYVVSFKMTNGMRTTVSTAGLGVADIGLLFSTSQPVQVDQLPINGLPQFKITDVFYSPIWRHFNFIFHADQAYSFMTIGLFGDDTDKHIVESEGVNPQYAYCFVDDFSMELLSDDHIPQINPGQKGPSDGPVVSEPPAGAALQPFYVPNSFTPNNDGYNDTFRPIPGYITKWEFTVYNRWGEKVFYTADEKAGWDGSYISKPSDNGSYIWEVVFSQYDESAGLVKMDQRGIVNLLR